jgi:hypothetical protein
MRKTGFLVSLGLAVVALVVALLIGGEEQPTMAVGRPADWMSELAHTVRVPLVMESYGAPKPSPFGVVMYTPLDDRGGLEEMQNAGAKWVTTSLNWSYIERSKGNYAWSYFDVKAQNAQAAGMEVLVLFTGNPAWAASLPGGPVNDIQDLVDFVTVMAERYDCDGKKDADGHPCVHYWSFYAEPDNGDLDRALEGRGYWGHNADGYAAMLSKVSPAIHKANPKAKVLTGGLAYDYFEEDGGPFVRDFLPNTLAALNSRGGAQQYIDAVAFHFYPINGHWPTIRDKAAVIKGVMTDQGAGEIPLACPEMGYWSSPKHGSSEELQAYRLAQMFVRGISVDIAPLSWFKPLDAAVAGSPEDTYPDRTAGLLRVDRSLKPSYHAFKTVIRELTGASYRKPFQAAGTEGYVFRLPDGKRKTVLWSQTGTVRVTFPYTRLRLVNTVGKEFEIRDNQSGSPGDLDGGVPGQIELEIYENQPFYVEQR